MAGSTYVQISTESGYQRLSFLQAPPSGSYSYWVLATGEDIWITAGATISSQFHVCIWGDSNDDTIPDVGVAGAKNIYSIGLEGTASDIYGRISGNMEGSISLKTDGTGYEGLLELTIDGQLQGSVSVSRIDTLTRQRRNPERCSAYVSSSTEQSQHSKCDTTYANIDRSKTVSIVGFTNGNICAANIAHNNCRPTGRFHQPASGLYVAFLLTGRTATATA